MIKDAIWNSSEGPAWLPTYRGEIYRIFKDDPGELWNCVAPLCKRPQWWKVCQSESYGWLFHGMNKKNFYDTFVVDIANLYFETNVLWSRITKNPDVSIGPLDCPFARSHSPCSLVWCSALLAPLACSNCVLRCTHSFARLLTHSLARGKVNDWMVIFIFWTVMQSSYMSIHPIIWSSAGHLYPVFILLAAHVRNFLFL